MKTTTLLFVLLAVSCSKMKEAETRPQALDRAIQSPLVGEFYRLSVAQAANSTPENFNRQAALMKSIRAQFPEFSKEEVTRIFTAVAARYRLGNNREKSLSFPTKNTARRYPYDTDCKADYDIQNNLCWSNFMWDQWWGFWRGVLSWPSQIDHVAAFTNCTLAAEKEYRFCSGD